MTKWKKRGRPATAHKKQKGYHPATPELLNKHATGSTKELVDVLLSRSVITHQQHWCALHFRWLYTLRYGLPAPTALNIAGTSSSRPERDAEWSAAREQELRRALLALQSVKAEKAVQKAVIYNTMDKASHKMMQSISTGLAELEKLWCFQEPASYSTVTATCSISDASITSPSRISS